MSLKIPFLRINAHITAPRTVNLFVDQCLIRIFAYAYTGSLVPLLATVTADKLLDVGVRIDLNEKIAFNITTQNELTSF